MPRHCPCWPAFMSNASVAVPVVDRTVTVPVVTGMPLTERSRSNSVVKSVSTFALGVFGVAVAPPITVIVSVPVPACDPAPGSSALWLHAESTTNEASKRRIRKPPCDHFLVEDWPVNVSELHSAVRTSRTRIVWYGRTHESGGTDRRAAELCDVQGAVVGGRLRGLPRPRATLATGHAQRVPAPVRHGALARRR